MALCEVGPPLAVTSPSTSSGSRLAVSPGVSSSAKTIAGAEPELIHGQPALLVRSSLIAAELVAPLPNVPVVFDTSSSNPPDHVVLEGLGHPEGSDAVLPLGI